MDGNVSKGLLSWLVKVQPTDVGASPALHKVLCYVSGREEREQYTQKETTRVQSATVTGLAQEGPDPQGDWQAACHRGIATWSGWLGICVFRGHLAGPRDAA